MSLNSRTKIIPREIKKGEQSKATVHSNTHILPSLAFSYFLFYFFLYSKWAKCLRKLTQIQCSDRMKEEEEKAREQRRKQLPEAPWVGAWQMLRTRSRRWRTVQRSGEAEGAAWEEGRPEGSPECSYGSARRPEMKEL